MVNRVHGMNRTPTHNSWRGMIERCTNPNSANWEDYGGRGITVCERWLDFPAFLEDMGIRPEGTTLDRIDPNQDYCPGNCRWATLTEQQRNKTDTPTFKFAGLALTFGEWAELLGINRKTLVSRYYRQGWSLEKTLMTPTKKA